MREKEAVVTHIKAAVLLAALLLGVGLPGSAPAQPPFGMGLGRMGHAECLTSEQLDLSEQQRAAVREAESRLRPVIDDLRNRMMARRMELESLLRNPDATDGRIRKKAEEISALRERLEKELLGNALEVRALLTPAQVRQWCPPAPGSGGMGRRGWMGP